MTYTAARKRVSVASVSAVNFTLHLALYFCSPDGFGVSNVKIEDTSSIPPPHTAATARFTRNYEKMKLNDGTCLVFYNNNNNNNNNNIY
jgi:hypothetical protein